MQIKIYNNKKELRKKSYSLKPFVIIEQHGLTDLVLSEIDIALNALVLIKILTKEGDKKAFRATFTNRARIECSSN